MTILVDSEGEDMTPDPDQEYVYQTTFGQLASEEFSESITDLAQILTPRFDGQSVGIVLASQHGRIAPYIARIEADSEDEDGEETVGITLLARILGAGELDEIELLGPTSTDDESVEESEEGERENV